MTNTGLVLTILFSLAACGFISCEQERDPCLLPRTVNLRVRCLRIVGDTAAVDSPLVNVNLGALDVDSLKFLYVGADDLARFSLRLDAGADSCRYLLQVDSAISPIDTLTFYYARRLQYLSSGCGYIYFFTLDSVRTSSNNLDSARVVNREVTTDANTNPLEHVQIYF